MRKYLLAGVMLAGFAGAAQAAPAPTIIFTPGVFTTPAFTTATTIEGFEGGAGGGATYNPTTQRSANPLIASESTTGDVSSYTGNVPGQPGNTIGDAVDPNPTDAFANKYLAVQNGTFTVNFSTGLQVLSFVLGTLDSYNSLVLGFADGTSQTFRGLQIVGQTPNGVLNTGLAGRVTYDVGGSFGITSAVFGSTQEAFEVDDIAAAVPEPGTWALMILGFGLAGAQLRARRRKTTVSFA